MSGPDESATAAMVATALQLADRAVVCDVETEGICLARRLDGEKLYDVTTMFDPREHSPEFLDMASQAIAYGVSRGLFELLPGPPMLVRLLRRPPAMHDHPADC